MQPALFIRLRPTGPWRSGPEDGAPDRVDVLYRSDRLFSAVTLAMQRLGYLNEWLDATVHAPVPAVVFSSLFPFQGETLFAIPPATLWPPSPAQVSAPSAVFLAKLRWSAARFVPLALIDLLATGGGLLADQWLPDPESGCLLRRDRPSTSPFRLVMRRSAAVDRLANTAPAVVTSASVEFEPGAGLWAVARYVDAGAEEAWGDRIRGAFRLLADSGFGGRRTSGWGHTAAPEFESGSWPKLLLPKLSRARRGALSNNGEASRFWMLSLYSPSAADRVDWSDGDYELATRTGRIQSASGSGLRKKSARMVAEGSVIVAEAEPAGAAVNVAPDGFAHPVYRSGLALALELPPIVLQSAQEVEAESHRIEEPSTEEAVIDRPCEPAEIPEPEAPVELTPEPDGEAESGPPVMLRDESLAGEKDGTEGEEADEEASDAL